MLQNNYNELAIAAALDGNWIKAVEFNQNLLKTEPGNIAALNRLGRAFLELNQIDPALKTYKRVIALDKYNPIAKKSIERIKTKQKAKNLHSQPSPHLPIRANFLEETGKTKTSQLVRLADAEIIADLQIGQPLLLDTHKRFVCVKTLDNIHIGSLPDDLCYRLKKLIKAGNKYETLVKSVEGHSVQVFIREIKRSVRLKNTPSFPISQTSSYLADIRHSLISEEPLDLSETGENSEEDLIEN